jgi:hypothetical protein
VNLGEFGEMEGSGRWDEGEGCARVSWRVVGYVTGAVAGVGDCDRGARHVLDCVLAIWGFVDGEMTTTMSSALLVLAMRVERGCCGGDEG